MSRLTPFDLAFAGQLERHFEKIQLEAAASRKETNDVAQFVSLPAVQQLVAEIESPELLVESPAAAMEYHMLLFVAFRYWTSGKQLLTVGREAITLENGASPSTCAHTSLSGSWM